MISFKGSLKYGIKIKKLKFLVFTGVMFFSNVSFAVDHAVNKVTTVNTVSSQHMLNWAFGLVFVLCLFFACVWFMRKMGVVSVNSKQSMRVLTGLSLGMREKLVLVQVGDKQLVLGVTPGRIDNLLVLEGDDQLFLNHPETEVGESFALKLKQVMAGAKNE